MLIVSSIFSLSLSCSCPFSLSFSTIRSTHQKFFKENTHTHSFTHTHTHRTPNTLLLIFLNAGTRHQITIYHALSLSFSFSISISLCLARSLTHPPNEIQKNALKYATRLPNRNSPENLGTVGKLQNVSQQKNKLKLL